MNPARARRPLLLLAVVLLAVAPALLGGMPARAAGPLAASVSSATPVTGSIGGTHVLAIGGHGAYYVNATGGPAYAANGSRVGNLTYYATIAGVNTTGSSISPASDPIYNGTSPVATLTVGSVAETLTLNVLISSVYKTQNESINLTYTVHVVQPYVVSATIIDVSTSDVLSFPIIVSLDGTQVGNVSIATITPNAPYHFSFSYLTLGLSTGWHTFTISLAKEHGLVVFADGATSYSVSIYVPGPPPDYTIWYIVGLVAFVGTIFILVTRVAARRRGAQRK